MLRDDLYRPWFVGENEWGVQIISGDFQDVIIQIEKVQFDESTEDGLLVDYHVVSKPSLITEEQLKSDMFYTVFQTIVSDVVKEALDIAKDEYLKDEQNRNDDSKESDSQ